MTDVDIRPESAPALGDVRTLGEGDHIYIYAGADKREDWPRYLAAVTHAVGRGANVTNLGVR